MKIEINNKYNNYKDFIENIPSAFKTSGNIIYEGRNSVKEFKIHDSDLIVKKYKTPNLVQRIVYTFFKKSKAERAFLYASIFNDKGIASPEAVAFIEIKKTFLVNDTFFLSIKSSLPSLMELYESESFNEEVIHSLAQFIAKLHKCGILHGDLNFTNILYEKDEKNNYIFTLIDTNRSKIREHVTTNEAIANLVRLTHNKNLLEKIIREYSKIAQLEENESVSLVMKKLKRFELRRKIKYYFKSLIKRNR